ncbi:MAG: hypothetical protein ABIF71_07930 [Planctomycetota bacterium]
MHAGLERDGLKFGADDPEGRHTVRFRAIACVPGDGNAAWLGFRGLRDADGAPVSGIARTVDAGRTWRIVFAETDRHSDPRMAVSYIEGRAPDSYPNVWFDDPTTLAASADGRRCTAGDLFRVYGTRDGGGSWRSYHSRRTGDDLWRTGGIDLTNCYGVHFDPFDPRHLYFSYTDMGLQQSWDGGLSFQGATRGMPNTWRNTTYWLALDPEVEGLVWAACSAAHDLPRPRMFRNRDTDTFEGGVCNSTDGGRTWQVTSDGLPPMACTHILLDPAGGPAGARTLWACGFGRGVFRSTDDGRTWAAVNAGIAGDKPLCRRLTRDPKGALYLVVARRSEKGEIGDERDGALYRLEPGADAWQRLALPEDTNGPNDLQVDPTAPDHLYLAMWGRYRPEGDIGGGVFMSTDRGTTWTRIFDGDQHVYSTTVDPSTPNIIYAAGFESSVYRSADRGATWGRLRGFTFKSAYRVIPDPMRPDRIFVTTFGGSVWHGPAGGDPAAVEDIITPLPGKRAGPLPAR